ncbi:MAG: DUF3515 domain-containing protein [Pseudonocardiaceae bacterium]
MTATAHLAGMPCRLLGIALALAVALVVGVLIAAAVVRGQARAQPGPLSLAGVPAPAATSADCGRLLAALPDELDGDLARRQLAAPVPSGTAAWGDPPVVLRCGLDRPAELTATSWLLDVSGVAFLQLSQLSDAGITSWVAVDRPVYVVVTMPADAGSGPLQQLAEVISDTLPPATKTTPRHRDTRDRSIGLAGQRSPVPRATAVSINVDNTVG